VLSVSTPATQGLAPADAVPMARDLNDLAAATVARRPEHFAAFATLATPNPDAAASELERAVTHLGMVGAMVHRRTGDRMLDDPAFDDVFAVAARLRVPVYIHPQIPPRAVRRAYYSGFDPVTANGLATGARGWHMEAGLAALRLILRGIFDRHPDLAIVLGHWGEMLPFWLDRVTELSPFTTLDRPIADYVRHNVYVTPAGIFKHHLLRHAIEVVGVDHILFSTDYPFQYAPQGGAHRFLQTAPIDHAAKHAIAHANAERLLRLQRRRTPQPWGQSGE
jgi:uncharacterized protein